MNDGGLGAAAAALASARRVAVLTGAGISAESGIPTFRDALTGYWARYRAEELATPEAFQRQPDVVWRWYAERREKVLQAEPNPGHLALVALAGLVPRLELFTQNVDGLHQRAGSPHVVELHGNIARVRCSGSCGVADSWDDALCPPNCVRCGRPLRPNVIWFGESLPLEALESARAAAEQCDVFLSVGTSNIVEPAASLPWIASRQGATVIVVNPDLTGQHLAPGVIGVAGKAGEVLPRMVEGVRQR
jgi:NAD-dependent deacetylase